ncbi:MAG TPA: hypothetical protein VNL70_03265 [Tepidisphaeraceae bacterium]|nr:hypothetical protein [Tepidisphaeraceae bacterium]
MGYDLHITRRSQWADDDGPQITLEAWKACVESDAEVRPDGDNGPTHFLWIASWFRHRRNVRELQKAAPALRVGQRVKNAWGELGTVLNVDQGANGGLGSVRVRLDDGREQHLALVASGLEILGDAAGG